jgi:predicted GIY-YIG superfamily endonuclease
VYYVYILKSERDGTLYKGTTSDLKRRLQEHNGGSSKYSDSKRPYSIVWYCAFPNKTRALIFEKYLKHGSGHAFAKKHFL